MRYNHFSMLPERAFQPRGRYGMTLEGGDSSPAPAQPSQVSQTTIPEYAKPYVEDLLGKAKTLTDVNTSPYQVYGGERIAAVTPEQQAARTGVSTMTLPGQFETGTNLASSAGLVGLGAGADYAKMATSAAEQAKYMSPYMQNVVDVQKQEAIRDAQKGQLMQNLGAARQGTYGGARQLLAGTERERNLGDQLAKIQASGSQSAFDRAQQAMQFGTQAGIQGAQAATQAGATLGQLGVAQQQQGLDLAKAQEAFGGLGRADSQAQLDLAYQDFLQQQRYPYAQLGFMSDILRGSGNLAGTGGTAVYQAAPSTTQNLMQLGLGGLGLYKALS